MLRRLIGALVGAILFAGMASSAVAEPVVLSVGETTRSASDTIPVAGWQPVTLPATWGRATGHAAGTSAWVRLPFARAGNDTTAMALFSDRIRERYTVFLNGTDIYRSNAGPSDRSFGWHRPLFVALPFALLRPGGNTVVLRIEADAGRATAVGRIIVGDDRTLRDIFRRRWFLNVAAPELISGVIGVLSAGALLFWVVRPSERVFGWLALVGLAWSFWNLQYFAETVPFDDALFWTLNADSMFLVFWSAFGFAATFFEIKSRDRVIAVSAAICLAAIVCRHSLIALGVNPVASFLIMWPLAGATLYLLAAACRRTPRIENIAMLAAMSASTGFGFHDLVLLSTGWVGVGFQLQPFGGLLVFLAFGFALGRRVLLALATVEDDNRTLEHRIRDATDRLGHSEAERRRLEVAYAVDQERERMMREIHDGIGSSLITALAVAKRERQSPNTIATLTRSISDLRVGIDSLEPVNGDVVMLLASLRHRMERQMGDAGLVFVWKTMSAPPLPWLDAIGALHILRILQEAIGNILKHADASHVEVDCVGAPLDGAAGVLVTIADDGCGFDRTSGHGRGLANMRSRAEALNAVFRVESTPGSGTTLSLWLPHDSGAL